MAEETQTKLRMALEDLVWRALESGLDRKDVEDTVADAIDQFEEDN
jgi:hypothetical protein